MSIISKLSQLLGLSKVPAAAQKAIRENDLSPAPPAKHSSAIQESKKEQAELAIHRQCQGTLYLNKKPLHFYVQMESNGQKQYAFSWLRTALEANLKSYLMALPYLQ